MDEDSIIREEEFPEGLTDKVGSKDELSIKKFIERKKLQNKILSEMIEKIKKSDSEQSNQTKLID